MASNGKSFTKFADLPPEMRDKIWDEAFKEFVVVSLRGSYWLSSGRGPFIRHGFDPGDVALSCSAAASRWRIHYPQRRIYDPDKVDGRASRGLVRLREETTILLGTAPHEIAHIMSRAAFIPRQIALTVDEWQYDIMRCIIERIPRDERGVYATRDSITKIRRSRRSLAVVLEKLIGMVRKEDGPARQVSFGVDGREWMQCVRPCKNINGWIDFTVEQEPILW